MDSSNNTSGTDEDVVGANDTGHTNTGIGQTNFQDRFWNLFKKQEMCDVTLIVGDEKELIKSHKVVLAAGSNYFKEYFFLSTPRIQSEVTVPKVQSHVLRLLLKFMYTGQDSLEVKDAISVLNAARYFVVPELVAVCERILKTALTQETALFILQQAIQYDEKELEETAKKAVCRFAYKILETEEFLNVGEECLLKFIGEDGLTVKSEDQVFDALIRWAKAECTRQGMVINSMYCRTHLEKLIPLIRFPQMDEGGFALKVVHGQIQILSQGELFSVYFFQRIPRERRSEVGGGLFNSKKRRYIDNTTVKIHIYTFAGKNVTLELKPLSTIGNIKQKIEEHVGILSNQQILTFRGEILGDGQTLLDNNILKESILQCRNLADETKSVNDQPIKILIRTFNERTITFRVHPSITIWGLKALIQDKTGISALFQRLSFSGVQIHNCHPLSQYKIHDGAVIHLVSTYHSQF